MGREIVSAQIIYEGEGRVLDYAIGVNGVISIIKCWACPEPHTGIEFLRIYKDNEEIVFNLNYIPKTTLRYSTQEQKQ